jgi:hypothetical protein
MIGANVVVVIVTVLLFATDWRKGDASDRLADLKIVGPAKLYILTLENQSLTTTHALAPQSVRRPKPPIAGPDRLTGRRLALSQFRGRPAFVCIWASWRVGALEQASVVARFARLHANEAAFFGIDSEDSKRDARKFAQRFHIDFPSIWDPVGKLAAGWSPVQTTLVFDRRHVLVRRISASEPLAQLNAALRRVLRG